MTILRHRGYRGSVAEQDGDIVVGILGIDDMISARAVPPSTAEEVFRDLVEDYLATCAEIGKEPQTPGEPA